MAILLSGCALTAERPNGAEDSVSTPASEPHETFDVVVEGERFGGSLGPVLSPNRAQVISFVSSEETVELADGPQTRDVITAVTIDEFAAPSEAVTLELPGFGLDYEITGDSKTLFVSSQNPFIYYSIDLEAKTLEDNARVLLFGTVFSPDGKLALGYAAGNDSEGLDAPIPALYSVEENRVLQSFPELAGSYNLRFSQDGETFVIAGRNRATQSAGLFFGSVSFESEPVWMTLSQDDFWSADILYIDETGESVVLETSSAGIPDFVLVNTAVSTKDPILVQSGSLSVGAPEPTIGDMDLANALQPPGTDLLIDGVYALNTVSGEFSTLDLPSGLLVALPELDRVALLDFVGGLGYDFDLQTLRVGRAFDIEQRETPERIFGAAGGKVMTVTTEGANSSPAEFDKPYTVTYRVIDVLGASSTAPAAAEAERVAPIIKGSWGQDPSDDSTLVVVNQQPLALEKWDMATGALLGSVSLSELTQSGGVLIGTQAPWESLESRVVPTADNNVFLQPVETVTWDDNGEAVETAIFSVNFSDESVEERVRFDKKLWGMTRLDDSDRYLLVMTETWDTSWGQTVTWIEWDLETGEQSVTEFLLDDQSPSPTPVVTDFGPALGDGARVTWAGGGWVFLHDPVSHSVKQQVFFEPLEGLESQGLTMSSDGSLVLHVHANGNIFEPLPTRSVLTVSRLGNTTATPEQQPSEPQQDSIFIDVPSVTLGEWQGPVVAAVDPSGTRIFALAEGHIYEWDAETLTLTNQWSNPQELPSDYRTGRLAFDPRSDQLLVLALRGGDPTLSQTFLIPLPDVEDVAQEDPERSSSEDNGDLPLAAILGFSLLGVALLTVGGIVVRRRGSRVATGSE